MKTAAEEDVSGLVNMATDKRVQFDVHPSYAKTNGTKCSIAETNRVESQLESEIYGITLKAQMWFTKEFSFHFVTLEDLCTQLTVRSSGKLLNRV
jgi:hypothetical protein